jgi:hypothetical protein
MRARSECRRAVAFACSPPTNRLLGRRGSDAHRSSQSAARVVGCESGRERGLRVACGVACVAESHARLCSFPCSAHSAPIRAHCITSQPTSARLRTPPRPPAPRLAPRCSNQATARALHQAHPGTRQTRLRTPVPAAAPARARAPSHLSHECHTSVTRRHRHRAGGVQGAEVQAHAAPPQLELDGHEALVHADVGGRVRVARLPVRVQAFCLLRCCTSHMGHCMARKGTPVRVVVVKCGAAERVQAIGGRRAVSSVCQVGTHRMTWLMCA